jgi:hypothetical protein
LKLYILVTSPLSFSLLDLIQPIAICKPQAKEGSQSHDKKVLEDSELAFLSF